MTFTYAVAQLAYLVAAVLFIFALYWMNDPKSARRAIYAGVAAMTIAVLATWMTERVTEHTWIIIAIVDAASRPRAAGQSKGDAGKAIPIVLGAVVLLLILCSTTASWAKPTTSPPTARRPTSRWRA